MSGRHSGGVRGTVLFRGICPVCQRDVAGGNVSRDRKRICLRPHKRITGDFGRRDWCEGGRSFVDRDDDATAAWGQRQRELDERRQARFRLG